MSIFLPELKYGLDKLEPFLNQIKQIDDLVKSFDELNID